MLRWRPIVETNVLQLQRDPDSSGQEVEPGSALGGRQVCGESGRQMHLSLSVAAVPQGGKLKMSEECWIFITASQRFGVNTTYSCRQEHERSSRLEGYSGCFFWLKTLCSMEICYVYPLFLYVGDLAHNRLSLGGRSCGLEIINRGLRRHGGEQ